LCKIGRKVTVDHFSDFALNNLFSTIHQLVKGHLIAIGQILADFDASCTGNGKIVEVLTQILHFLKKEFSRWAEEMS
jgi:hypothetical protein